MFKEIYDKSIENIPSNRIPAGFFEERPIMVTGMISPETEIEIQPLWGYTFNLDKDGMHELIEILESKWQELARTIQKRIIY